MSYYWLMKRPNFKTLDQGVANLLLSPTLCHTVYWQGTEEESGEADGIFEPSEVGDPDPAWIAYITAEK